MKFLVDSLPYYEEYCPFHELCMVSKALGECPRFWDKYEVASDNNTHECNFLIEQTGGNINEHD